MDTVTLAFLFAAADDPVKDVVLKFLASYLGLAAGVSFLVSGAKALFKAWSKGKEAVLTIILSMGLGTLAKLVTDVYGENSVKSWSLHLVVLVFVAVGAAAFHDKFTNAIQGKLGSAGGAR